MRRGGMRQIGGVVPAPDVRMLEERVRRLEERVEELGRLLDRRTAEPRPPDGAAPPPEPAQAG
ncbi:hypothetical protein [Nocardiopsis baichengensis]|uniref:hypothetical protein n=1 Tax=Nocardiopsis baichengensis TaxID=280240 RepID=UPI0012697415|nr:hypothetical protein [Nocardiopsis baichengensis]